MLNHTVVDNHIFSATKIKLKKKYKSCHEDASATGTSIDSKIVPFAKVKIKKTLGSKESRELAASNWVKNTCRDIQTAVIKTCAYTNRYALKCAFGEDYNELYPGTIYSPPSSYIMPICTVV